ncbi:isoprenylcysteine carboxylmethyltransferase family protein [Guyparkeria sp. 1SP6A2]|nr:isoprenylcysteine carboxylmethyltransferase family protein [Guyparkeria sp. 1SP6A2]
MFLRLIPPPVALLISIVLAYALSIWWPIADVTFPGHTWAGSLLIAAGLGLMLAAAWALWCAQTTINPIHPERSRHLVTSGIYCFTRNPIYLGDALILAGVVFWLGNVFSLLAVAAFVVFIDRIQIAAEEKALQRLFGNGYANYRARTHRWLGW